MTTLLDKSTPVPEVKGFHLPNFTPKAHAYRGKSLEENHLNQSGIGGREVGTQKSGSIEKNYVSGVNHNHNLSRPRYGLKGDNSTHEHRLKMPYGKVKEAHYQSVWSLQRTENSSPGSWYQPDRGSTLTEHPQTPDHPRPGKSPWVHTFTPIHFQEFIL